MEGRGLEERWEKTGGSERREGQVPPGRTP